MSMFWRRFSSGAMWGLCCVVLALLLGIKWDWKILMLMVGSQIIDIFWDAFFSVKP